MEGWHSDDGVVSPGLEEEIGERSSRGGDGGRYSTTVSIPNFYMDSRPPEGGIPVYPSFTLRPSNGGEYYLTEQDDRKWHAYEIEANGSLNQDEIDLVEGVPTSLYGELYNLIDHSEPIKIR